MARLVALREKRSHRVVGLMSGTSADGIDAALCLLSDGENGIRAEVLAFETYPFPTVLSDQILAAARATAREVAELSVVLAQLFSDAARRVVEGHGAAMSSVDLIGSHGQTICHVPPAKGQIGATLQIGNPAVIATRTGCPVISDFRSRDMALGGQGAPLVPIVDHLLFGKRHENRVLLNIGGIANITATNGVLDDVLAFDTGPGNALLDSLVRLLSGGQERYDRNGEMALRGKPLEPLLRDLLAHPFLSLAPPKSADRDIFGEPLARRLMAENADVSSEDLLATAAAFTAESICLALENLPSPFRRIDRLIVSGGGVHHRGVMDHLRRRAPAKAIETSSDHGIDPDAKEAVAFAVIARETLLGRPANLPRVTGASKPAILGSITF